MNVLRGSFWNRSSTSVKQATSALGSLSSVSAILIALKSDWTREKTKEIEPHKVVSTVLG